MFVFVLFYSFVSDAMKISWCKKYRSGKQTRYTMLKFKKSGIRGISNDTKMHISVYTK